ncbi:MAG TPA: hypothetical protein VGO52_18830 [Hyphomonadaceae bacterium]|jgi:hypothetical protein|nr:hypothetical protein [Hyphomonadaceae bacterium]
MSESAIFDPPAIASAAALFAVGMPFNAFCLVLAEKRFPGKLPDKLPFWVRLALVVPFSISLIGVATLAVSAALAPFDPVVLTNSWAAGAILSAAVLASVWIHHILTQLLSNLVRPAFRLPMRKLEWLWKPDPE